MPEKEFNEIFSKRLRYFLNKYEMTQLQLAKELGVGTTSVYNWCNAIKTPRMDKVDAMCNLFHCKRSDLMEEKISTNEKIIDHYNKLNDLGKREATKRVEELTYFPQYTQDMLELKAAHNDHISEPGELEKVNRDMELLKRPN